MQITFASNRSGSWGIYNQPADRSGEAKEILPANEGQYWPESWSPDGITLAFTDAKVGNWKTFFFDRENGQVRPLFETEVNTLLSTFSPSGNWLAYTRTESRLVSSLRVAVKRFPDGLEYEVGRQSGNGIIWGRNEDEVFYSQLPDLWSAEILTEPTLTVCSEAPLPIEAYVTAGNYRNYDFSPVRDQFVVVVAPESDAESRSHVNVVTNWLEELKERVPVP